MLKIGKKYWHPEFGWVVYQGLDYLTGMYHIIDIYDDGVWISTTLNSTALLFDKSHKIAYNKMKNKYNKYYRV